MLYSYQSAQLQILADRFIEVSATLPRPLLAQQPVVVPNMAVGRWLVQQMARQQGVCANIERVLPAALNWRLHRKLISGLPPVGDFDRNVLLFRVLKLLQDNEFISRFPLLSSYLQGSRGADRMALASRVTRVFDAYQVYRPDWLDVWLNGELLSLGSDECWQQALWQRLRKQSDHPDRAELENQLVAAIKADELELPANLCVFGIATITPNFHRLLQAMSTKMDVYVFAFSPAIENGSSQLPHWQVSGEVLGQQFNEQTVRLPTIASAHNTLGLLQSMLQGRVVNPEEFSIDDSVLAVSCYSPMREVSALYDYLNQAFVDDDTLQSGDVLVAMPKLDDYAPFIRAVFGASESNIPFNLSDSLLATESPLTNGLQALLELPSWRFTREQVRELLQNRLVRHRFELSESELEQIDSWLDVAGVRWGIDSAHRQSLGLPATDEHSWRAGLDRMLLGFALPQKMHGGLPLYHGVLPGDDIDSGGSQSLSRFIDYCDKLFAWHSVLQQPATAQQWQLRLQRLLADFFLVDEEEDSSWQQLLEMFDSLSAYATQAGLNEELDYTAIADFIQEALPSGGRGAQLSGRVNFSGMSSLAGIPCKRLCLLGMNYDSWPSKGREPGFDLLQKDYRKGDRNRSDDERYLTLQLLLSANSAVYLSYIGRNIHNGDGLPPSVLVSELLESVRQLGGQVMQWQHPMHAYSPDNFTQQDNSAGIRSSNPVWLSAAAKVGHGRETPTPLITSGLNLDPINAIDGDQLINFFTNPQKYFLRQRLGITLRDATRSWDNDEPVDLGNFIDARVRELMLKQSGITSLEDGAKLVRAENLLPHGQSGDVMGKAQQEIVERLLQHKGDDAFDENVMPPVPYSFSLDGIQLSGSLPGLRYSGLYRLDPNTQYAGRKIESWLRHLILCCARPEGIKCITQVNHLDGLLHFPSPGDPELLLMPWLKAFIAGQVKPLPFMAKASYQYAESFAKYGDAGRALNKAQGAWEGGFNRPGIADKPEMVYLYRHCSPLMDLDGSADPDEESAFQQLAEALLIPMLKHSQETDYAN